MAPVSARVTKPAGRAWLPSSLNRAATECNFASTISNDNSEERAMQSMTEKRTNGIGTNRELVKAVAVIPGKPNTIHLREVPKPRVEDVQGGRGVLIKILRVGVDGTDKEINAAEYGAAPSGDDYLIIGHESFGRVEALGPNVTEFEI